MVVRIRIIEKTTKLMRKKETTTDDPKVIYFSKFKKQEDVLESFDCSLYLAFHSSISE